MSYLQCPECRLTVPAAAYYLRGDECPRCLAKMERRATFRTDPGLPSVPPMVVEQGSRGSGAEDSV